MNKLYVKLVQYTRKYFTAKYQPILSTYDPAVMSRYIMSLRAFLQGCKTQMFKSFITKSFGPVKQPMNVQDLAFTSRIP